jgi:Mg-chelatase subunit ChlI
MKDHDFSFMKSGLSDQDNDRALDAMEFNLVSLYMKLLTVATKNSKTYCAHHGRTHVHSADIVKCLRHQARVFLDNMTDQVMHEAREELLTALQEDDDPQEEESESSEEEDSQEYEDDTKDCDCDLCTDIDTKTKTWKDYVPDDEILEYLKYQVDRVSYLVPEERRHLIE